MTLEDRVKALEEKVNAVHSTEIMVVLDRSGSMHSNKTDHEGGLNAFVEHQKLMGGQTYFTLAQFDDINPFEVVYNNVPIQQVNSIKLQPRGCTPLLDAIGKAINQADNGSTADKIIYIISDGQENASKEYTQEAVRQLIETKQAAGWQFMFLGTNFDALTTGKSMGFDHQRNVQFTSSNSSINKMYDAVLTKTGGYIRARASGSSISESKQSLNFTAEDIAEINNED